MPTTITQQPGVEIRTVTQVIAQVRAYVLERKKAYEVQRFSVAECEKLAAIEELLHTLEIAHHQVQYSDAAAIKTILKCTLELHYIAPTKTRKLHRTWYLKIENIMAACRNFLGWQKQTVN